MVSGRIGAAISAELGAMVVSQQIDAMRAFGTDPIRKLVAPRIIALIFMLPLLTVAADILGLIGGGLVANWLYNQDYNVFINSVRGGISTSDLVSGLIKPLFFGLIIGSVACHKGLTTTGGTVGVGRSTDERGRYRIDLGDHFRFLSIEGNAILIRSRPVIILRVRTRSIFNRQLQRRLKPLWPRRSGHRI
jgi:hypothetical protein